MTEPTSQLNSDASTVKAALPSASEVDPKTAQRYFDIAKTTISQASTTAILWLAAVIVVWWSIEQEIVLKSAELKSTTTKYLEAYKAYETQHKACLDQSKKQEHSSQNRDNRIKAKVDVCEGISSYQERINEAKLGYNQAKNSAIDFNLPTFPKFRVPTQLAPLVLTVIILSLAGYMAFMRERVFRYLSKALQNLKETQKIPLEKIGDVLAPRPWWISPLPSKSGESISPDEFASSLGWSNHKEASLVFIGLFWFILLLIQFLLIIDGASFNQDIERVEQLEPLASFSTVVVSRMYWCFFGMTVSLAVHWFWPSSIVDTHLQPRAEINHSRRTFLLHLTAGTALALVMRGSIESAFLKRVSQIRRPRYRTRQVHTITRVPKDGLLLNPRSGVAHAIHHGRVVGLDYPKDYTDKPKIVHWHLAKELDVLSFTTSPKNTQQHSAPSCGIPAHMNKRHVSLITEAAFFRACDSGQYQTALAIMARGIEQDIACKKRAGHIISIDAQTNTPLTKPRRKPRKRHKVMQNISNNLRSPDGRDVRRLPRVSFRLYDSLARASVKLGRPDWLKELRTLIDQYELRTIFESRIANWENPNSEWYRGITKQGRSSNVG